MLHLQAGIDFQEVIGAVGVHQKFHGAGAEILGGPGDPHRGVADLGGQSRGQAGGGDLDEFLVAALDGAVPGAQVHHVAVGIGQDLDLHVPGPVHVFFQVDVVVPEGHEGLGAGALEPGQQTVPVLNLANAPAAAAGYRLDHDGIAVGGGKLQGRLFSRGSLGEDLGGRDHPDAGGLGDFPGDDLASQVPDDLRGRPDKHQARIGAGFGEIGVFRQKAVAGMNGLGPGLSGRRQ